MQKNHFRLNWLYAVFQINLFIIMYIVKKFSFFNLRNKKGDLMPPSLSILFESL